ncbi:Aldo/keto reductase [Lepidopterella palustris CBS 459.81]|uniref:Aldo/keto reductase n=1 Tax=Lepidopterella palustris CBS 459.81 TaxID=1314670 RepID=A0A8E2JI91_9PEZI|nr:Aldo/keto reductase [Lepidopterella palustris CBS 459.81]
MVKLVGKDVGEIGYGLMGLTWRAEPPSQEQSFKAMRAALSHGANAWNGGELYGSPERNSLHLLNEYFTKYPEDAEKIVLSIKGCIVPGQMRPDGSEKGVRRSIDECLRVLDGKKFLDLFECARIDPNTPIETTIGAIAEYVKAGKIGGISLSEVGANTIRKASKVHKISAVEVEFSLWSTDILENGVAQACAELDIPIVAYSPLGRGFLTGQIKSYNDIPEDSMLRHYPRFQPDVFDENLKLVREVEQVASQKGCTPAQIALAWIRAHSGRDGLPVIIPIPGATTEERVSENMAQVTLSQKELAAIDDILQKTTITGMRYPEAAMKLAEL